MSCLLQPGASGVRPGRRVQQLETGRVCSRKCGGSREDQGKARSDSMGYDGNECRKLGQEVDTETHLLQVPELGTCKRRLENKGLVTINRPTARIY